VRLTRIRIDTPQFGTSGVTETLLPSLVAYCPPQRLLKSPPFGSAVTDPIYGTGSSPNECMTLTAPSNAHRAAECLPNGS